MAPYPGPGYPGASQPYPYPYPYPAQGGYRVPQPPLQNVTATRFFAAGTLTGFVLIIISGFLTFTYVTPKASGDNSMISGWGEWTHQGEDLPLHHGASAMIVPGVLLPLLILLPTVLMAIIILCNIARRPLSIVSTLFAVVASLLALGLTMAPDDVVIVFDSSSNDYIDKHYDFSTGPSAWLSAAMCILITVCCIGGIIFGGKAKT
ncbi:hypothetical protein BKN37_27240 [Mycobacterium talmoniae]|uniref:Uncharacterized protein n=1 Tax=Mycobacterium talmoniae TaxID=1858794 RepID=A0A1S1MEA3_9MYCO|nr:hypothetical protein BKN37_27240 [Mycobacterium talmoniae]